MQQCEIILLQMDVIGITFFWWKFCFSHNMQYIRGIYFRYFILTHFQIIAITVRIDNWTVKIHQTIK